MTKYRVTYDVHENNNATRSSATIEVEAESDMMAAEMAEAQYFHRHPTKRGKYTFTARSIKRK